MKNKIVLILFSLICLNGLAQSLGSSKDDHLEPVEGYFDMYNYRHEYYANIRSILLKGLAERAEIKYLVKPSFEAEYVLQVELDPQSRKNTICVKKAKESIWYAKDKSKIEVETWRNSISQEDVDLIKQLYRNAILKTQYVVRDGMGLDGTTYFFTVSDRGMMSGQTWSPSGGTTMDKLVKISEAIVKEAKATTFAGLSAPLRAQIKELTNALFL